MTRVSSSELKARLSAYLDIVRQGEEVLVTSAPESSVCSALP